MGILDNPIVAAAQGIGNAVSGVARVFVGDKGERDAADSSENMAGRNQFAAEFKLANRNWFDSAIDGFNRLPRPLIVAMIVAYFNLAWMDPIQFQIINAALDTVPTNMWIIAGSIVSFFFVVTRELANSRAAKMALSAAQFAEHMRRIRELEAMKRQTDNPADESKPLSDEAIKKWNESRE